MGGLGCRSAGVGKMAGTFGTNGKPVAEPMARLIEELKAAGDWDEECSAVGVSCVDPH